jgi:hypothetical protein
MSHVAVRIAIVVLAATASIDAQSKPAEPVTLKASVDTSTAR